MPGKKVIIVQNTPNDKQLSVEQKIQICKQCLHFKKFLQRCELCGCFIQFKTRLENQHCPKNLW